MQKFETSSKHSNTFLTNSLSQFLQSLNATVSINCLIFVKEVNKQEPLMSQNTLAITLWTDVVVLNYFPVGDVMGVSTSCSSVLFLW
jgi:hypothetical protein